MDVIVLISGLHYRTRNHCDSSRGVTFDGFFHNSTGFASTMSPTDFFKRICSVLLLIVLCVGCNEGPRNGKPVAGAPDADVELLTVIADGNVEHSEGKFLELVQRADQKLILVDFWASWCGPCRKLAPTLEKIKSKWGDDIEVVKVDVDQCPEISQYLDVTSIPDVRIYRGGTQVGDFVGTMPFAEIDALLKSLK
jgi:thioredoxin 1